MTAPVLPARTDWQALRCRFAGEALARILIRCGYEAACRPRHCGEADALFVTVGGETRRLEVGPVKLLWRGRPLNRDAPDWPREVPEDAARFFLTARSLSAPAELDLDLAVRRDFDNPFYAAIYVRNRLRVLLSREEDADRSPIGPEGLPEDGRALALAVGRFPAVVRQAAERCDPYPVNRYAAELAGELWRFVQTVPLAGGNRRLGRSAEIALRNALGLLGCGGSATERSPL